MNTLNLSIVGFISTTIPTNDRVSATDLTKAINFELVDNEQVTLVPLEQILLMAIYQHFL